MLQQPLFLSRLLLDSGDRAARADLADCAALHRRVMSAFLDIEDRVDARATMGILHRIDTDSRTGQISLLVQSGVAPDWSRLPNGYLTTGSDGVVNPASKRIEGAYAQIELGARLRFRLRANPTRKIDTKSGPDGARRNGRRVELTHELHQLEWLKRQGDHGGFSPVAGGDPLSSALVSPAGKAAGRRPGAPAITLAGVVFEGALQVTDVERFHRALRAGVGPGKAFGFGLLTVAPLSRGG